MAETHAPQASIADWLDLIRAEYREVPGLHLTKKQFERLWGLDSDTCDAILQVLVDGRFLRRSYAGGYLRAEIVR
jgi:hypothetical protein